MNMPLIRMEVEGMKHAMVCALSEYALLMSDELKKAVEAYCQPANIQRVLSEAANRAMEEVIREEVDKFMRYGNGRTAISAAIAEKMNEMLSDEAPK